MTVFVDSNIPMYVAGRSHQFKAPCIEFMRAVARRRIQAVSDVEVLQEILYRYDAVRQRAVGVAVVEAFIATVPLVYPVLLEDPREQERSRSTHGDPAAGPHSRRRHASSRDSHGRELRPALRCRPDVRRVTPDELV